MKLAKLWGITAGAILVMATLEGALAAKNTGAVVLRPKQNAKVQNVTEVIGKIKSRGFPVVLVRADQPSCLWWVQPLPTSSSPGQFKTKIRIGNEKTPRGTRFRVVVLVLTNAEAAKQFAPGKSFKKLPEQIPRSVDTIVVLQREKEADANLPRVVSEPVRGGNVGRVQTIKGKLAKNVHPIVLVRSALPNSLWWVQGKSQVADDHTFQTTARFGNAKTPAGTRFRLVVILADEKQAAQFAPGASMKDLPKLPRSAEVGVVRKDASGD